MTNPRYRGVTLCYDQSGYATYDNACRGVNEMGNGDMIQNGQFVCEGILMSNFHDAVVAALGQDVCVCSYQNTNLSPSMPAMDLAMVLA